MCILMEMCVCVVVDIVYGCLCRYVYGCVVQCLFVLNPYSSVYFYIKYFLCTIFISFYHLCTLSLCMFVLFLIFFFVHASRTFFFVLIELLSSYKFVSFKTFVCVYGRHLYYHHFEHTTHSLLS
jgi:hypothetical protein